MTPAWIDAPVREFGQSAGLRDFSLNEKGVAAVKFENGVSLRFEYAEDALAVVATVPAAGDAETLRAVLAAAHPDSRSAFRLRSGWRAKTGRAVFAVRLAAREVTTPAISAAFSQLWRAVTEIGGGR